jgi:hypothetical protein
VAQSIATGAAAAGQNFGATYTRIQGEISAAADKMRSSLKSVGDGGVEGADKASDAFKSFAKQLTELTAQIDRAKQNGTPMAELVRLFGDEAAKATPKARAWGIAVEQSVLDVSRAFNAAALDKTMTKLGDQFAKFFDSRAETQFKKLQAGMHESAIAMVEFSKLTDKAQDSLEKMGETLAKKQFDKLADSIHNSTDLVVSQISPMRDAFLEFGRSLPDLIFGTLKNGGNLVGAIAAGLGATFAKRFQEALDAIKKAGSGALTSGQQASGRPGWASRRSSAGSASGLRRTKPRARSAALQLVRRLGFRSLPLPVARRSLVGAGSRGDRRILRRPGGGQEDRGAARSQQDGARAAVRRHAEAVRARRETRRQHPGRIRREEAGAVPGRGRLAQHRDRCTEQADRRDRRRARWREPARGGVRGAVRRTGIDEGRRR